MHLKCHDKNMLLNIFKAKKWLRPATLEGLGLERFF